VSGTRFIRVHGPSLLAYPSLVDFVPSHKPYEFSTEIELTPTPEGSRVVMTVHSLHDDTWTQRLR
jgi:hypothetical protein